MIKRKLILHIGTHKTGTSSIQQALYNNRVLLNEYGYKYFIDTPDGIKRQDGNTTSWIGYDLNSMKSGYGGWVSNKTKLFSLLKGKYDRNVIISNENFSWLFSNDELISLKSDLSEIFDEIKIIVYLRRQDLAAVSHYQQASKRVDLPSTYYYGKGVSPLPDSSSFYDYFDYYERIKSWSSAFGRSNVNVRVFEKEKLRNGDVVDDFLHILKLDLGELGNYRTNESNGKIKTKLGHLINENVTNNYLSKYLRSSVSNEGKFVPQKKDAIIFYSQYQESNKKLEEFLEVENIFSDNFEMYKEIDTQSWTEREANQAISEILEALNTISFKDIARIYIDQFPSLSKFLVKIKLLVARVISVND
ncbi:hypothetical protein AB4161_20825 [Vibrio sp. 10N.286.51.E5]|uniref:hypothetical protein n=1 Tax=Vibrio sp. 10N.286.51.E5 TaxID=3229709 RepID=UPI00355017B5